VYFLQLLPYFVMIYFSDLYGFAGLFLATLYGASLRSAFIECFHFIYNIVYRGGEVQA